MMEVLRGWLLGVLAASMLASAALAVMPEGPVRSVGRLVCGLLLFLTVVRPLSSYDGSAAQAWLDDAAASLEETQQALTGTRGQLTQSIIDSELDAYIQDKTAGLGLDCRVEVLWDGSGSVPVPAGAVVTGALTGREREQLTGVLSEDLGLLPEQIVYRGEEGT